LRYLIIADTYEKIEATSKRIEMRDLLADLVKVTPKNFVRKMTYLTQGKLYPDYMGIEIGMAEKMTIESIHRVTGVEKKKIIESWKIIGDLGSTAEKLIKRKRSENEFLTAEKIYKTFEKIAYTFGKGSFEIKINLLSDLLKGATPKEAKYLVRTVTRRLRLGIGDMTFLDALNISYTGDKKTRKIIERAYNLSSDLGLVSEILAEDGLNGVKNFKIKMGRPIRPMLAGRMTSAEEIIQKLGELCAAEYKYDGLRLQCHIHKGNVKLFSRRLEDLTKQFPDVIKVLKKNINSKEAIVDGECVAVNPITNEIQPFQVITQRRGRKYAIKRKSEEIPVVLFIFDVLYVDGENFIDFPYPERRNILESIVVETDRVKLANKIIVENAKQLDDYLDKAIEDGCEGLVVKSVGKNSIYRAGSRGFLWIKYKKEYKSELSDTLDLVVVGSFVGYGRRAGTYGALLMAAYDKETDTFKTTCKLGTGFDDITLAELPKILSPYMLETKSPRVDSKIEADYWFTPNIVLETIGSEITLSPSHTCALDIIKNKAGLAVRFPRFSGRWRKDKAPEDSTNVKEIIDMYRSKLKKIQ
jgi:DNA ligase-1